MLPLPETRCDTNVASAFGNSCLGDVQWRKRCGRLPLACIARKAKLVPHLPISEASSGNSFRFVVSRLALSWFAVSHDETVLKKDV